MTGNSSEHKKRIGRIGTPDDPALPKLEYLMHPEEDGQRTAVVIFKSGAKLQFREDSEDTIHQETFFSSGRTCESFEVGGEKTPPEHLKCVLMDYSTISKDDLRIRRPGLWPILEVE